MAVLQRHCYPGGVDPKSGSPLTGGGALLAIQAGQGTYSTPGPGCWIVTNDYRFYNFLGWTLATSTIVVQNYCWARNMYGYMVITTTPNAFPRTKGHWGWQLCDTKNFWSNWVSQYWEYGAGADFQWDPVTCGLPTNRFDAYVNTFVWGDGTYSFPDGSG